MQKFITLLQAVDQWYWFGFAVIMIILEVLLGVNFFLLWLGLSAATVGIVVWMYPALSWEFQLLLFGLESLMCVIFWNMHLKHRQNDSDQPFLNRRNHQYIGRSATLAEPIINGRGRIHIDDSFWRIEGPDLPVGTLVKIVAVDGVVLKVEPA